MSGTTYACGICGEKDCTGNCLATTIKRLRAELDDARRQNNDLHALLSELRAVVLGECPSLLDEDSDGFGDLAIRIDAALGEKP